MGKLKILASDHKRADSVGANKNLKFLNEILIDHKKVMQQNKEEIKVAEGKVRIENGKHIEEIIIPVNTPGVCEINDEKTLKVSFDTGDGKSLPFLVERKGDMVVSSSYFKIGAKKWVRTSKGKKIGKVDYEGKTYSLVNTYVYERI